MIRRFVAIKKERVAPTCVITSASGNPLNSAFSVTYTFSEVVTGFAAVGDISVTNGSTTAPVDSGDHIVYTSTITPTVDGDVTITVPAGVCKDNADNPNRVSNTLSRAYETVHPTCTITSASANPLNTTFSVTFTFSESVTGFVVGDITVTNGSAGTFAGTGTTYTATITPVTDGAVTVKVAADSAQDAAGNGNLESNTLSRTYDITQPSCIVSTAATEPVSAAFTVVITFSESVTGFVLGDITVANGTASAFTGSGAVYGATITPTWGGTVSISVAAGVCVDAAGNANTAGGPLAVTVGRLKLSITTTAPAQTATLQRITPTGGTCAVIWGDGAADSTIANGNTGTTTHVYASAGTYTAYVTNANIITYLDLRDIQIDFTDHSLARCSAITTLRIDNISGFNSVDIASMALTYLFLSLSVAGTYTFNSDHIKTMALTTLFLSLSVAGTFNSDHIKTMALTYLYLYLPAAGTYTFNSDHIKTMALTYLLLNLLTAGTYTFNSDHIKTMALTYLYLYLNTTTLTTTITRSDWDALPACATIQVECGLSSAKVDAILLGLYDGFATKTVTNGTVDLLGNGNAAPSGVSPGSAACPPLTGYDTCYELVNDSCNISTKHYASVTVV